MALQLIIAEEGSNDYLVQKFFTRKRKVEKVKFEFEGGLIKGFIVSYVPRQNALVIFVERQE